MPMETSHIWLGIFPSEAHLDDYFNEQYDDDDAPINKFAEGQGESHYDHDWVERGFNNSGNLRSLIEGHSYSDDYIDKVIDIANAMGISNANTFIMADAGEFGDPQSIDSCEFKLWYVGEYECNV